MSAFSSRISAFASGMVPVVSVTFQEMLISSAWQVAEKTIIDVKKPKKVIFCL
jgi:hypothetical protein